MFEPISSQLAYPELLHHDETALVSPSESSAQRGMDDVSRTWYPPLKSTLALLSKLYGVVEMAVFEDFARRGVFLCVQVWLPFSMRLGLFYFDIDVLFLLSFS